jgi:acyl-coenzyme A thioesterase PaaI-like protein
MTAHAKLIRLGRRSAVAEVELYSEGLPDMVAHATATYALPRT